MDSTMFLRFASVSERHCADDPRTHPRQASADGIPATPCRHWAQSPKALRASVVIQAVSDNTCRANQSFLSVAASRKIHARTRKFYSFPLCSFLHRWTFFTMQGLHNGANAPPEYTLKFSAVAACHSLQPLQNFSPACETVKERGCSIIHATIWEMAFMLTLSQQLPRSIRPFY